MRALGTVTIVLALVGCEKKQPAARAVIPPSAAEADEAGRKFARQLAPCSTAGLNEMIDEDLLIARAVANRTLRTGDLTSIKRHFDLGARLCEELADPGLTATLLRTQMIDGAPRPLIRVLFTQGVNYYQLELDKRGTMVNVADMYLYLAGETMSEMVGGIVDAASKTRSVTNAATTTQMKKEMQAGRWEAAHALLKELPAAMRASKAIRLLEVQIASNLGDDAYVKAMDEYAKAYPDDPSLALVQIDQLALKNEHAKVLEVIDKLDRQLGGDPYLEVMRLDALTALGKHADAVVAARRATVAEPTLEQAWWGLLTAQTNAEQYADAVATLEDMRVKRGLEITAEDLAADTRYTKLVESDAFKASR